MSRTNNILFERYRFHQRCQNSEETLQTFVDDVRDLAKACEFHEYSESFVRDRILFGLQDEEIKWRIIHSGGDPTLDDVMSIWQRYKQNESDETEVKVSTFEHWELPVDVKIEPDEMPHDDANVADLKTILESICCDDEGADAKSNSEEPSGQTSQLQQSLSMSPHQKLPCPFCSKPYAPISMPTHIQRAHNSTNLVKHRCTVCHKMISFRSYTYHMQSHLRDMQRRQIICLNCDSTFVTYAQLETHMEGHSEMSAKKKSKVYVCLRCSRTFKKCNGLRVHLAKNHRTSREFECTKCNLLYPRLQELNRHIKRHCPCDVCSKYFPTPYAMKQHRITHGGSRPFECFACHKTYGRLETMRMHIKYCMLREDMRFTCDVCQRQMQTPFSLRKHMRTHEGRTFTCEKCNRSYYNSDSFERHNVCHRECDICHQYMLSEAELQLHMIEHLANYAFECFECHYRTASYKHVRMHMRTTHKPIVYRRRLQPKTPRTDIVKPHLCAQCGARFATHSMLKMHLMRQDHQVAGGGGVVKPFECEVCQRRFVSCHTLNNHMRRHTGQNPYRCEICGKAFPDSSSLCEHRQGVHLQKDRHKCTVCNYKCYKASAMKKHILTHGIS